MPAIAPLPVVVPFLAATLLVAVRPFLQRALTDGATIAAVAAVIAMCALLLAKAARQPIAYWLAGFAPRHGVTIGISLSIDQLGAGIALLSAVLVGAAMIYSLRYFDSLGGLFQPLMLLFAGAMAGFCLTGDLFNLVVFFELMGVVAYALTAYRIEERAPIQGAINFAITNSIAGYAMFIAVAMLYARTGALNMAQIGAALGGHRADPLVIVALVLLLLGFLTKAAAVPLHFWLADAHAVAPIPVCVLFSGVMVELGVYAVARLYWQVFAGTLSAHELAVRAVFVALGVVTALLGAVMCFLQRHVKRLLAFSTISHIGMFICGVALLTSKGIAGVGTYLVGHGMTKAALFMCAGVLIHRFATIDEYDLHGRGRGMPAVGVLMAIGALLVAALPPFTTFMGKSLLEEGASAVGYNWLIVVFIFVSAMTGGAVLRVTGRVFLGWGPTEGPHPGQAEAAREEGEEETGPPAGTQPLMLIVPAVLLLGVLLLGLIPGAVPGIERLAAQFVEHRAYAAWVLHSVHVQIPVLPPSHISADDYGYSLASTAGALVVAGAGLFGRPLRARLPQIVSHPVDAAAGVLHEIHSGHIGDYITWWTAGVSVVGGVCLIALR